MKFRHLLIALTSMWLASWTIIGHAQSAANEDFTQATTTNSWYFFNGACLTAGTGTSTTSPGTIPSCNTISSSYYGAKGDGYMVGGYNGTACPTSIFGVLFCNASTLPDSVGQGALRFTNGYPYGNNENGAIVSSSPFNSGQGVQITFKTVSYRGDSGGAGRDGADGLSFYLIDATQFAATPTASATWNGVGAYGGSLGYTCSNTNSPYNGLDGAYLGLGIDEYGNFLNAGDNTATGYGAVPKRIGLRGAGNVSWAWLNANYGTQYPSSLAGTALAQTAVANTCKTGTLWDYSSLNRGVNTGKPVADYAVIPNAYAVVGALAGEYASGIYNRQQATPIVYNLKITQNGLLSLSYSTGGAYSSILSSYNIATGNAPLPKSLYFGFAGSSGGSTNIHEILCFKAATPATSSASAATNEQQTSKLQTNAQEYYSYYDPSDWTGRLTANTLIDTNGVVTIASLANWDAQCNLTGSSNCSTTTSNAAINAQVPNSRVMLTWNGNDTTATPGTSGIPFEWPGSTTGITAAQQAVLDAGDSSVTANRLNYLRGVRTNEINSAGVGLYRARDGILGDIVDSSPVWVGPPTSPYMLTWKDRLTTDATPENSGQLYATFKTNEQSRVNVVYSGSNDGFLHGFRSGTEDSGGNLLATTAPNDGAELLAYMPGAVLQTIHNSSNSLLDYSNSQYAHNFFVDAPPGTGDLFYGGVWHTWLVGGLGAGGSALYALDITDPTGSVPGTTAFTELNAAKLVVGEWGPATISCYGDGNGNNGNGLLNGLLNGLFGNSNSSGCGANLGNTYGTPLIRRLHNGMWGVIFGNGYNSTTGDAGIYVMTINQTSGATTFYYLSTGTGTVAKPSTDGIAYLTASDLDGDHITDYVYAGDLLGNVWRFDLTSSTASNWAVSSGPVFTTSSGQPITTAVVVTSAQIYGASANAAVTLSFGTGQRTQITTTSPISYASGQQSLYTVWDWNYAAWNSSSSTQFLSLTAAQAKKATNLSSPYTLTQSNLRAETLRVNSTTGAIDASNTPITWEACTSSTVCNSGSFGWYETLPGSSEQVVSPITLYQQGLIINTTVPASNAVLACTTSVDSAVTYVLSVLSGGSFATSTTTATTTANGNAATTVSTLYTSAFTDNNGDTSMVGTTSTMTGGSTVINTKEGTTYIVAQGVDPGKMAAPVQISLPVNTTINRQTWIQLR